MWSIVTSVIKKFKRTPSSKRCILDGFEQLESRVAPAANILTWTGLGINSDWNTPGNWSPMQQPNANTNVIIAPGGHNTANALNGDLVRVANITIENSGFLFIQRAIANTITVESGGQLIVQSGTFFAMVVRGITPGVGPVGTMTVTGPVRMSGGVSNWGLIIMQSNSSIYTKYEFTNFGKIQIIGAKVSILNDFSICPEVSWLYLGSIPNSQGILPIRVALRLATQKTKRVQT